MLRWRVTALGVLAAGVLAFGGCGEAGAARQDFGPSDVAQIRERTQEFARAFNAGEVQRIAGMYTDQAVFLPPNTGTLRGRDSLPGFFAALLAEGATDLTMEPRDVSGQGPLAYESGSYVLLRKPEDGRQTRDRGKYLFVLRHYNEGWLYEYFMWSSDLPAPVEITEID
jgi:uncharacterized protein (TIGR02246 family)